MYGVRPNPAQHKATIRFDIQESVPVSLVIVNTTGEVVATVLDGKHTLNSGQHAVDVDLSSLPAGVYSYVLSAGVFSDTKYMVIVR